MIIGLASPRLSAFDFLFRAARLLRTPFMEHDYYGATAGIAVERNFWEARLIGGNFSIFIIYYPIGVLTDL